MNDIYRTTLNHSLPLTREYRIVSSGAFKDELVRTSFHATT